MSAQWPSAVVTTSQLYIAVNELQNNLSAGINAAVTTVPLNSATSFPTVGLVLIDNEVIQYTGVSGNNLTGCTRAFDGTTAATHSSGATVSFAFCAAHYNNAANEVIAVETYLDTVLGKGTTVTATEFAQLSGVTSAIQTQLNAKEPTITTLTVAKGGTNSGTSLNNNRVMKSSGGSIVEAAAITASKALASDANGIPVATSVTDTELGYVSGVTSAIQTQLNALSSHYFQYTQATTTAGTSTTSATFVDGSISASITPSSSTHKVKITINVGVGGATSGIFAQLGISANGSDLFTVSDTPWRYRTFDAAGQSEFTTTMVWVDSPATTSAVTYKLRVAVSSGANALTGGALNTGMKTTILLEEIL